jgi:hypothetical protein
MLSPASAVAASLLLFVGMLVFLEFGRRLRVRRVAAEGDQALAGAGVVDGAVFALMGLLLAFTFSGAAARFDERRRLIVEEANAIGTAYLRLDLLAPGPRDELRGQFRRYLDTRLAAYRALPDVQAETALFAQASALQREIWAQAVRAAHDLPPAPALLLPALHEMFDVTTARSMAARTHPPSVIFYLLFGLAILSALLAGLAIGTRKRNWIHLIVFAATISGAVYVIMDLEYPRSDSFASMPSTRCWSICGAACRERASGIASSRARGAGPGRDRGPAGGPPMGNARLGYRARLRERLRFRERHRQADATALSGEPTE